MPRPPTGTIERHGDHYDARLTLADGSRPRVCMPPGLSEARARDRAKRLAEAARAEGATKPRRGRTAAAPAGETVAAWVERWTAAREERGLSSASGDLGRLRKWLFPQLGEKPITAVTRRDVEAFVEHLDTSVRAGEQSWKTAVNTWGLVSKLFDDACNAKALSLRVLGSNPAAEVRGPDRGIKKAKAYLYPSEFLSLVSSPNISIEWRRAVALATYLYVRASELRALTWDDIDLERGIIHVHRSLDREGGAKPTKTGKTRRFSIELALMPLLRAMHAESGGRGRVVRLPDDRHLSRALRGLMTAARLDRSDLFAADTTRKNMTWHDLRATGITWLAIRGDDALKIMQRAGHAGFQTTQGYIREAEAVRAGFGDVFPPLPLSLWEGGVSSGNRPERAQVRGIMVEAPGIEPGAESAGRMRERYGRRRVGRVGTVSDAIEGSIPLVYPSALSWSAVPWSRGTRRSHGRAVILGACGLDVSWPAAARERVLASTDLAELDRWICRSAGISSDRELLARAGLAE